MDDAVPPLIGQIKHLVYHRRVVGRRYTRTHTSMICTERCSNRIASGGCCYNKSSFSRGVILIPSQVPSVALQVAGVRETSREATTTGKAATDIINTWYTSVPPCSDFERKTKTNTSRHTGCIKRRGFYHTRRWCFAAAAAAAAPPPLAVGDTTRHRQYDLQTTYLYWS